MGLRESVPQRHQFYREQIRDEFPVVLLVGASQPFDSVFDKLGEGLLSGQLLLESHPDIFQYGQ